MTLSAPHAPPGKRTPEQNVVVSRASLRENQSSSRKGSGLGGLLTSSPILTAARASMAISSGSGAAVATTPEGGSPAEPSSSEDVSPSPNAAIDILYSGGAPNEMLAAPWDKPAKITREPDVTFAA